MWIWITSNSWAVPFEKLLLRRLESSSRHHANQMDQHVGVHSQSSSLVGMALPARLSKSDAMRLAQDFSESKKTLLAKLRPMIWVALNCVWILVSGSESRFVFLWQESIKSRMPSRQFG